MGPWGRDYLRGVEAAARPVVTVRWCDDSGSGVVFSEAFSDWLDAAHAISGIQRYVNLELVAVECEDGLAAFRDYCRALKPAGVRF